MVKLGIFLILTVLILLQVNVISLNLGFASVVVFFLVFKKDFSFWWLFLVALILSLLANLNIGVAVLAFSTSFLLLDLGSRIFPDNRLAKFVLVLSALLVGEYSLVVFGGILT